MLSHNRFHRHQHSYLCVFFVYTPRGWQNYPEACNIFLNVYLQATYKLSPPISKCIIERTSTHCMRARIQICHEQIRSTNRIITENYQTVAPFISDDSISRLPEFIRGRANAVGNHIARTHMSLSNKHAPRQIKDTTKWMVNFSVRPLSSTKRSILKKDHPRFHTKKFIAEIEAAITTLPEESKKIKKICDPSTSSETSTTQLQYKEKHYYIN